MDDVIDILMWRRPLAAVLLLGIATAVYYHCQVLRRTLLSLTADTLLVLACSSGIMTCLTPHWKLTIPVDPLNLELSEETANYIVESVANLIGAVGGVMRATSSGSDYRLFIKIIFLCYLAAVVGKVVSGPTFLYIGVWLAFILPSIFCQILPDPQGEESQQLILSTSQSRAVSTKHF
jgi:hypothetical protein